MASHDYHDNLPNYSAKQVLVDGCGECEYRAALGYKAVGYFDNETAQRAYDRAHEWNSVGLNDISKAEIPVFDSILRVESFLNRIGIKVG